MMAIELPVSLRPVELRDLVRLGQVHDGGYVLPQDCIDQADALLSFGLSANWEFEKAFLRATRNKEIEVHAYDHTVSAAYLRNYRLKSMARFFLTGQRKFLTAFRMAGGYAAFFDGKNAIHFIEKVSWKDGDGESSIRKIMGRLHRNKHIFLNMDIEGYEFRVTDGLLEYSDRFTGMGIEFHDLDILRRNFWELHEKILEYFVVAHIHVNNVAGLGPDGFPNILEMTYMHRRLLGSQPRASTRSYPLEGLDMPNAIDREDYTLLFADPSTGSGEGEG
jgi:hypothetical protein